MINTMRNKSELQNLFLLTLSLLLLIGSVNFSQTLSVKIIETSDVHGAIFPYNFTASKSSQNSLAQIHSYVESERANKNQEVILIDNGDILQGDPSVYYYNFEKTDTTHLLAQVMNYMKYDVATVGNHDIETGHPVYDKFTDDLNFPWLAANAINTETGETYFPPYHIIKKDVITSSSETRTIKIAILGMITPGIPNWLPKNIWSGIEFEDMILTAKKWVPIILEKEKPDLLVGLFHAGVDHTYDGQSADTPRNENASQLVAKQIPGFDIIFVGHDHHEWNYKVADANGDSVLILGPASRSRSITAANVNFNFDEKNNRWDKNISSEIINTKNIDADPKFLKTFSDQFEIVKKYVSRPIGEFTEKISARKSIFGNSSFVDLIHKIQLELTDADISFTAPLSIHTTIPEGKTFVKDMFNLYRYENLLYTMELSGQEIQDYLEYSYSSWFNTMKSKDDNLLQFERDENDKLVLSKRSNAPMLKNRYYNFDSAEGIKYEVNVSKPNGQKVNIISMSNGDKFDINKKYKVAINSYRGNGGGGHLVKGAKIPKDELTERVITSTEKDLRYYMMKWIEKEKTVLPTEEINWKVIPEELVDEAKKRDYELMFSKN